MAKIIRALKRFVAVVCVLLIVAGVCALGYQRYQLHQSWAGGIDPSLLPPVSPRSLRIAILNRPEEMLLKTAGRLPAASELKIVLRKVSNPDERWQLLAAGEVDLVVANLSELALAQPRFDPGVVIAPLAENIGSEGVVSGRSTKAHPSSLVAYLPGGLSEYLARSLNQTDLRVVASSSPEEAMQWLQSGQVGAAGLWEPFRTQAIQAGGKLLLDTSLKPTLEVLIASKQVVAGASAPRCERADVAAFVTAWYQFMDQMQQEPALAKKAIAADNEVTAERVETCLHGLKFYQLNDVQARLEMLRDRILGELQSDSTFWSLAAASNQRGAVFVRAVDLGMLGSLTGSFTTGRPGGATTPDAVAPPPAVVTTPEPVNTPEPARTSEPTPPPAVRPHVPVDPFNPSGSVPEPAVVSTPTPEATPEASATPDEEETPDTAPTPEATNTP